MRIITGSSGRAGSAVAAKQRALTVEGAPYQGIAALRFRRVFKLGDYVQVKPVSFGDGLRDRPLARGAGAHEAQQIPFVGTGNENRKTENTQAA